MASITLTPARAIAASKPGMANFVRGPGGEAAAGEPGESVPGACGCSCSWPGVSFEVKKMTTAEVPGLVEVNVVGSRMPLLVVLVRLEELDEDDDEEELELELEVVEVDVGSVVGSVVDVGRVVAGGLVEPMGEVELGGVLEVGRGGSVVGSVTPPVGNCADAGVLAVSSAARNSVTPMATLMWPVEGTPQCAPVSPGTLQNHLGGPAN